MEIDDCPPIIEFKKKRHICILNAGCQGAAEEADEYIFPALYFIRARVVDVRAKRDGK
jgi:hypothetical protein